MDKFIIKTKRSSISSVGSSSVPNPNLNPSIPFGGDDKVVEKRPRMEFSDNDIVSDLVLCKPIEEYPISIRDEVRRRYLVKCPCQSYAHKFPSRKFDKISRCFREEWFKKYDGWNIAHLKMPPFVSGVICLEDVNEKNIVGVIYFQKRVSQIKKRHQRNLMSI